MLKKRVASGLEEIALLCEPVAPPKDTLAYVHYFCGNPEIPEQLKARETKRTALYKKTVSLIRSYANIADEMEEAGYTETEIENIKNEIYFSEPLILRENVGIIFPNTINIIQGKAGVHKSRLTEDLCSLLISNSNSNQLGFSKLNNSIEIKALYVDTERNLKDQFPFALQKIIKKAIVLVCMRLIVISSSIEVYN